MAKQQLQDSIRELICKKYDLCKPATVIAEELDIHRQTVESVIILYKNTGRIASIKERAPKAAIINRLMAEYIREIISDDVSITLKAMQACVFERFGLSPSISTLQRGIRDFEYSFKRITLIPEGRNTERTLEIRYDYAREIFFENEEKIIYLDEMGVSCSMRCRYGRSPIGTTPRKSITAVYSRNYSVCAAMSKRGLLHFEVSDRAYNGERFNDFLLQLFEELSRLGHTNMLLVMDNCPMHKTLINRAMIVDAGHRVLFLPPYTPQLNPIEEVFSKWKTLIKSRNCVNAEALLRAVNTEHLNISITDCENYIMHSRTFLLPALEKIEF